MDAPQLFEEPVSGPDFTKAHWRLQAAQIVAELFPVVGSEHWDDLLELHQGLLHGADWNKTLDLFLHCRQILEADNYVPFFRLRRLLDASLRLQATFQGGSIGMKSLSLGKLLRKSWPSLSHISKELRRKRFENDLTCGSTDEILLHLVEV